MYIYSVDKHKLNSVDNVDFKLEKDIQDLCESNINTLFGLNIITSEFTLSNLRMDTFAYDSVAKSFVIMEYKKDRNFSVIDQGYAYLSSVLNNKADCILAYNETHKTPLKRDSIDWTQTRIIFYCSFIYSIPNTIYQF